MSDKWLKAKYFSSKSNKQSLWVSSSYFCVSFTQVNISTSLLYCIRREEMRFHKALKCQSQMVTSLSCLFNLYPSSFQTIPLIKILRKSVVIFMNNENDAFACISKVSSEIWTLPLSPSNFILCVKSFYCWNLSLKETPYANTLYFVYKHEYNIKGGEFLGSMHNDSKNGWNWNVTHPPPKSFPF